jgi:transposase-like protein
MDEMHTKNDEKIESDDKYKCEECGINFGNSIGYMERHKLTVHLQREDMEIE